MQLVNINQLHDTENYDSLTLNQKKEILEFLWENDKGIVINSGEEIYNDLINNVDNFFYINSSARRDRLDLGVAFSPKQAIRLYKHLKNIIDRLYKPLNKIERNYETDKKYLLTRGSYAIDKYNTIRFFNADCSQILYQIDYIRHLSNLVGWLKKILILGGYKDKLLEEPKQEVPKTEPFQEDNETKLKKLKLSNPQITVNYDKLAKLIINPTRDMHSLLKEGYEDYFWFEDTEIAFSPKQALEILEMLHTRERGFKKIKLTSGNFIFSNTDFPTASMGLIVMGFEDTKSDKVYWIGESNFKSTKQWLTEILSIGGYNVLEEEPMEQEVKFVINPLTKTTDCQIDKEVKGTARYNKIDNFDSKKGKLISFARALDFDTETVNRIIDALFQE